MRTALAALILTITLAGITEAIMCSAPPLASAFTVDGTVDFIIDHKQTVTVFLNAGDGPYPIVCKGDPALVAVCASLEINQDVRVEGYFEFGSNGGFNSYFDLFAEVITKCD